MTASVIGSETINWGTSADPTGQTITIPSDCTKVLVLSAFYLGGAGGLATITLASTAPNVQAVLDDTASTRGTFAAVWESPPTGSQTLDLAWDSSVVLGPTCSVIYVKDADSGWRDVDYQADVFSNPVSVTLTTVDGDLVIKHDVRDNGDTPPLSSGWTSISTQTVGNEAARASYILASGASTVCDSESESGSVIIAVAFAEGSGEGQTTLFPIWIGHFG